MATLITPPVIGFLSMALLNFLKFQPGLIFKYSASNVKRNLCSSGNTMKVHEVQIPVPWGLIAGKWWGCDAERPLLALHGWQDNAGSWDTLAPLLIHKRPILAIDFPGHGKSSWFPKGMRYTPWDYIQTIQIVMQHYKWNKVSILAHSMGSITGMRYAGLYPNDIDLYIGIENLVVEDLRKLHGYVDKQAARLLKILIAQERLDKEPPSYPYNEALNKWHLGTYKSVSLESARYLAERGIKESLTKPGNYYFSRDSRLKYSTVPVESESYIKQLITRAQCPILYIKAKESDFGTDDFSVEIREMLELQKNFSCHFVPGTHHVHLNNPEEVAPLVLEFLDKNKDTNSINLKDQNR